MNRTLTLLYVLMTAGVQAVSAAVPEHGYVDLGLSVMWADANVGADSQSAPGTYFIWDGQDHAAMEWGGPWRTPSKREWDELLDNCSFVWTDDRDGASGYIVTSCVPGFEGRSMFIPAAGCLDNGHTAQVNVYGSYWTMDGWNSRSAFAYNFDSSTREWHTDLCTVGQSIRAVRDVDGRQTGRLGLYLEGDDGRADGRTLDLESGYSYRLLAGSTERCVSAACRWSSSNPSVASVTPDGVVFALSSGTATITAQVLDRKTACRVRVMDVEPECCGGSVDLHFVTGFFAHQRLTDRGFQRNFPLLEIHLVRAHDSVAQLCSGVKVGELDPAQQSDPVLGKTLCVDYSGVLENPLQEAYPSDSLGLGPARCAVFKVLAQVSLGARFAQSILDLGILYIDQFVEFGGDFVVALFRKIFHLGLLQEESQRSGELVGATGASAATINALESGDGFGDGHSLDEF